MSILQLSTEVALPVKRTVMVFYLFLLGNTHFAITWALYLNSANLGHFRSSPLRKLVYFVVPAIIMLAFFALGSADLPPEGAWITLPFWISITAIDYFHAVRQTFGVLQMFKARAGASGFPRGLARMDNTYFLSLWALQVITFANGKDQGFDGRFDGHSVVSWLLVGVAALLFGGVMRGMWSAWRSAEGDKGALAAALVYFLLQAAGSWLVVWHSRLYFASLAMHYVEYHVLIAPRIFEAKVDPASHVDRFAAVLRRRKIAIYAVVVAVAACVSAGPLLALGGLEITKDNSRFGWLFVNLLNGIFVAHYFVEAFVWKFRNPFYKKTLAPLYFARSSLATSGALEKPLHPEPEPALAE